jgi:putative membrane protein
LVLAANSVSEPTKAIYKILIISYLVGFGVELLGTNTGFPFGAYTYGQTLGWKIFNTPLMIGVNWAILVYASLCVVNLWGTKIQNDWLKAGVAATLMLGLDIFIEPVAIRTDFWTWQSAGINDWILVAPYANYLAWWVIAYLLLRLGVYLLPTHQNKTALCLLVLQYIFFIVLYLSKL